MIAHAALVLKDTFASRFASIQSILDSVDFLENYIYKVILAKFFKILYLYVIFVLILCCVHILESGTDSLMYNVSLVRLCIKPRQTCQHLGAIT